MEGDGNTHQSKKTKLMDKNVQDTDHTNMETNLNPSTSSITSEPQQNPSQTAEGDEEPSVDPITEHANDTTESNDEIQVFRRRVRHRNYRRSSNTSSSSSSFNNDNEEAAISSDNNNENGDDNDDLDDEESNDDDSSSSLSSNSDYSPINSDFIGSDNANDSDNEGIVLPFIETETLKNRWQPYKELQSRVMGYASKQKRCKYNPYSFQNSFYGSLYAVQKLSLLHKLNLHDGCVNSLNFNHSGKLLASGSDDLKIIIWDWKTKKIVKAIHSGHKSNVFQTKFIEDQDSKTTIDIVSTGRDGQVRFTHLRPCGTAETSLLFKMSQSVHKIAISPRRPREILAAGEDGVVRQFDLRTKTGDKIVKLKKRLYSISTNPIENEFCISGSDKFVRVYDYRNTKRPFKQLCPESLISNENGYQTVTCCVYNNTGSEILASYGDQDIFLFENNSAIESGSRVLHSYSGHCNSKTIKGVNFFGQNSEYIVSGSDCGHIFFWDKESETVAKWMKGDETGVVNCLEPHPVFPILASSGLDNDVKIWIPKGSNDEEKDTTYTKEKLERNVRRNLKLRRHPSENIFDDRILDFLIFHRLRNARRQRVLSRDFSSSDNSNDDNDEDNEENDENRRSLLQCNPS